MRGDRYDKTWLYRMDWIRRCKGDEIESPCNVEFDVAADFSIHGNGPYRVVDSSHVAANETQYELRRDYKPTLLSRQEAATFVAPKAGPRVTEDRGMQCKGHLRPARSLRRRLDR